jgi:hypothetical protein
MRTETMTKWTICGASFALLVSCTPRLWAQVPAAPAPPAPPPLVAPPAAPAAAPQQNLWSFLLPNQAQKAGWQQCKEKICATQAGQLFNNTLLPIGAFTGGLLGPCCPLFNQADLLKPADSAEGAAARIKADEADAKARAAAVRYLARADCAYWPEAADALVNALRADRNECVRFAAAQALGTGCCCGKKTIVALSISAAGSDRDGNPPEKSDRVRFAAQAALENCLARCGCAIPVPTEGGPREKPAPERPAPETPVKPASATEPAGSSQPVQPTVFYKRVETMSGPQVVDLVRQSFLSWSMPSVEGGVGSGDAIASSGQSSAADHSLFGLVASAIGPVKDSLAPPGRRLSSAPAEVAKVSQPPPATPYQTVSPVETVGYHSPKARSWSPAAGDADVKPAVVAPAKHISPVYFPPAVKPATPAPAPTAGLPLTHFPPANGTDFTHTLTMLREGTPSQRAWAAAELAGVDGRGNPDVVDALVVAGQLDTSAAVRLQCVRSLVKMNADGAAVIQLLEALQTDRDAAVAQQARQALRLMSSQVSK